MGNRLSNRARVFLAGGAALSTLLGFAAAAPIASAAPSFPSYTLSVAPEGTQPTAPRYFEGFSNTINVAGSETAEYALEQVGALYNNAGIFGCNQNGDKRTCNEGPNAQTPVIADAVLPSTDVYDNFDHDVVNNAQAVGSAAGVQDLCTTATNGFAATEPSSLSSTWPYYTYPVPQSGEGADGIPIDLVRASASAADLSNHGVTVCSDLGQQGVASDAVIGLTFSPTSPDPDGSTIVDPVPAGTSIDFSNTGGPGSTTDTAWRVFCDTSNTDGLAITTWDQLAAAPGEDFTAPTPDQPIVLWGTKNNSGTGATWYTYAGCGTTTGRIASDHLITENDAQQLSQYAAENSASTVTVTNGAGTYPVDNCGGNGTSSTGLGTSSWTVSNEACVAQEVADSIFFMSYGYYASHPFTASVTIPTAAVGSLPSYIQNASNYEVVGTASTIGGAGVNGGNLGQPGSGVTGDPRASNPNAVQTGRDLWLDYLTDHVRASAAAFVNWVCDSNDRVAPKGIDLTTGVSFDTEITNDMSAWGFGRLNCDAYGTSGTSSTYAPAISSAVIDPGPPNNE